MSFIINTLRGAGNLIKYAARVFALTFLAIDLLYGLLLAAVAFWIAADGSIVRGVLAAIVALLLVTALAILAAIQLCVGLTISRAIDEAQIGRRVFDQIFDITLGVTNEQPEGNLATTQSVHGLSIAEVEAKLKAAGDQLLAQDVDTAGISSLLLWIADRIQRALVWATIKVIVRSCVTDGGDTVDLLALRARLAGVIDNEVASYVKQHSFRLLWLAASLATSIAILVAYLIRLLPL